MVAIQSLKVFVMCDPEFTVDVCGMIGPVGTTQPSLKAERTPGGAATPVSSGHGYFGRALVCCLWSGSSETFLPSLTSDPAAKPWDRGPPGSGL